MINVNVKEIANPIHQSPREREQIWNDGNARKVLKGAVYLDKTELICDGEGLLVRFLGDAGAVECASTVLGFPPEWDAYESLDVHIVNGTAPLLAEVSVLCAFGRVLERVEIAAGEEKRISVNLRDVPLAQSKMSPYRALGVRIRAQWGNTWKTEGELCLAGMHWEPSARNQPVDLHIKEISLVPCKTPGVPHPVVDEFGQRINGNWPGKVKTVADLKRAAEIEESTLTSMSPYPDRDRFGGWTGGNMKFGATGFFRVQQDNGGRWWYVTPEGNPFISSGTTGVRTGDSTVVTGREFLFDKLPALKGKYSSVYAPCKIGEMSDPERMLFLPNRYNVLRKWGTMEKWAQIVLKRIVSWGMNTIANWSDSLVLGQEQVPFVRTISSRPEGEPRVCGGKMPDVWSDEWKRLLDTEYAVTVAPYRDETFLLGYFCDNEFPWHELHKGAILDCPDEAPARAAFVKFFKDRYSAIETFNRDFSLDCQTWSDARTLRPDQVPQEGPAVEIMREFVGQYAENYFRVVNSTIKMHDPNHLYLGCRFVRIKPDRRIVEAAGRHCDVVSVNSYDLWPRREQFEAWYMECGKPIQIGEFCFALSSERMIPALWPTFTAAERKKLYIQVYEKWMSQPWAIGTHWFTYEDMIGTGRPLGDGGNQPGGFVDIADVPHQELVDASLHVTARMYAWHAAAQ